MAPVALVTTLRRSATRNVTLKRSRGFKVTWAIAISLYEARSLSTTGWRT
jgi:hypothetical protein